MTRVRHDVLQTMAQHYDSPVSIRFFLYRWPGPSSFSLDPAEEMAYKAELDIYATKKRFFAVQVMLLEGPIHRSKVWSKFIRDAIARKLAQMGYPAKMIKVHLHKDAYV